MTELNRSYRLGLDLGSNSIGWFVIWLDDAGKPCGLGPGGVRIFPDGRDPQSKASNAAARRVARGMRRRRDRYLKRREQLVSQLVVFGLMPTEAQDRKALEGLDPYELRAAALDCPLPLHHVGRVLFHLNQRRGFRSNRKTDGGDSESGPIKEAVSKLQQAMKTQGARTLGEFLWHYHRQRHGVRIRNSGTATKVTYDLYPSRAMSEKEFDAVWKAQAPYHPEMTEEARDALRKTVFYQRPLREQPVGKCALDPAKGPDDTNGFRLSRAHPLAQRFRILQEVNSLEYGEIGGESSKLSDDQRKKLVLALCARNKLSFDRMRTLLQLPEGARFNLESDKRKELKGDETATKLSHKNLFGKQWRAMTRTRQCTVVEKLLATQDEDKMVAWLVHETGLDEPVARRVSGAVLPQGYARLGRRAIGRLLPHMEAGLRYDQAATGEYGSHSERRTGEAVDRLPYYGAWMPDAVSGTGDVRDGNQKRWGRLPNPTVHIGLGQLRRVVNAVTKEHGPPEEVVVEMTRDFKLSPSRARDLEHEQASNQHKNEERDKQIRALGYTPNARDRLLLRLWEELDPLNRCCPFSGERISIKRLFSEEVEIEHLIPFSKSWDDSAANKVVAMRFANRDKGQNTAFAAFGNSPTINGYRYDWAAIAQRAANLPKNKGWRFAPDALQRFEKQGGFLGRQLNETGWFARLAKDYVKGLTGTANKVWVVPGRLTEMIRAKWGLNDLLSDHNIGDRKNRLDHRHHAIDSLVAGLTDRSLLQAMASAYDSTRDQIKVPPPWETLRDDLRRALDAMTVSHRTDHAASDRLHKATAYGTVKDPGREGANLVYRKDFMTLTRPETEHIRDVRLRNLVETHVEAEAARGKDLKTALASFNDAHKGHPDVKEGIRRVRILKSEKPEYLVAVRHGGRHEKFYSAGENAFVDIYETSDGKWQGEATTVFQANRKQSGRRARWRDRDDARFVMRIRKGDLIALDHDGKRQVMVVHRLEASANRFRLAPHNEAGNLDKRHTESCDIDPFRWLMASYGTLKKRGAEHVRVDGLGRVWRISPDEGCHSL